MQEFKFELILWIIIEYSREWNLDAGPYNCLKYSASSDGIFFLMFECAIQLYFFLNDVRSASWWAPPTDTCTEGWEGPKLENFHIEMLQTTRSLIKYTYDKLYMKYALSMQKTKFWRIFCLRNRCLVIFTICVFSLSLPLKLIKNVIL